MYDQDWRRQSTKMSSYDSYLDYPFLDYYSDDENTNDQNNKKLAVEPIKVLNLYQNRLTNYEKGEILNMIKSISLVVL